MKYDGSNKPYERQISDHKRRFIAQIRKAVAEKIAVEPGELETLIFTRPKVGYMLNLVQLPSRRKARDGLCQTDSGEEIAAREFRNVWIWPLTLARQSERRILQTPRPFPLSSGATGHHPCDWRRLHEDHPL